MGGRHSKNSSARKDSSRVDMHGSGGGGSRQHGLKQPNYQGKATPSQMSESMEQGEETISVPKRGIQGYGENEDAFYDGIPRFSQKSRSRSSRVSERLGRAGTFGIEKAVGVLDTLGSSMKNLNSSSGFASGPTTKGNELAILSFEVANTIMKGSNLTQSLSKRSIRLLKEVVFPSEGVQNLVSKDMDELLRTVAADKREGLIIFSGEVVRFGNRCKDPQWHNLDIYFEKHSRGVTPPKQLKEEIESVMEELMTLVQYTAELYLELHTLDKLEEEHQRKHHGGNSISIQKGNELMRLKAELKVQRKQVKLLKKKSLWSRSMEEVMEKLVDTVVYLNREIQNAFDCASADDNASSSGSLNIEHKLGPAGLALHYANIVLQIDSIVARSSSMPPTARDSLYHSLPPNIKLSLRTKLQSFHVKEELSIKEIKAEMEKTLSWLAPMATNTARAYHGFGWVGEWAETGSEANRKPSGFSDTYQIETLHHADKGKTEAYIVELLLWLNHLINQNKVIPKGSEMKSPIKSPIAASSKQEATIDGVETQGLVV